MGDLYGPLVEAYGLMETVVTDVAPRTHDIGEDLDLHAHYNRSEGRTLP
jgi:hypothetical protein